jgi:signal transduction histidine kinase/ActR/RegA family two-component response regulator
VRIPKPSLENLGHKTYFRESNGSNSNSKLFHLNPVLGLSQLFAIPSFDKETERQFWEERYLVLLTPLKWALCLGALTFLAYIALDLATNNTTLTEAMLRLPIVLVLLCLFRYLNTRPQAIRHIHIVAKLSASLSALNLMLMLLYDGNPGYYAETWPALLPMYFFSYGQMFMSLRSTISFGWISLLAMPATGYLIGVPPAALIASILNLLIVNIFGLCTRCQLEAYSRRSFTKKCKAEHNAADKTRFLHQLSHNLRQPLQALSCYSSVLETACEQDTEADLRHIASRMGLVIDELNNAFNCILDITNLENGKQIPLLTSVDINVLLASLENQFAPIAAQHGIKLKIILRAKPPYNVHSDISILSQIISNLIDNAIKYTHRGWIVVAAVKISPEQLKLHIYDTGAGIATSIQKDIFKEFFRNDRRQTDTHTAGLGLGLAYVGKAIQRLPNHYLKLTSKPQTGSDFQMYLPTVASTLNSIETQAQHNELTGRFVLVVDDDADVLKALTNQLKNWGCLVQQASSLDESMAILQEIFVTPDLLITDFYLNNHETAHDIIAAVHEDCGSIPTLILSARAIQDTEKAKLPAHTAILRKPASSKILMDTMAKVMHTNRQNEAGN